LIVPLPLPRDDYMKDFGSDESKRQFLALLERAEAVVQLPPQPSRTASYRAAGIYVLDHCDVLIAVWDGNPGRGASGTAEIVAEARHRKLPTVWVHVGTSAPEGPGAVSFAGGAGTITTENF
jgi:hypothetical protein